MKYTFSNDLLLGHYEMDTEHAEIVIMLNKFLEAVENQVEIPEIARILKDVIEFVEIHFSHEEKLMEESNFKGYEEHKKHHAEFIKIFREFLDDINIEGFATKALLGKMHVQAMDLLVAHVKTDDKIFARYLKSSKIIKVMKFGKK